MTLPPAPSPWRVFGSSNILMQIMFHLFKSMPFRDHTAKSSIQRWARAQSYGGWRQIFVARFPPPMRPVNASIRSGLKLSLSLVLQLNFGDGHSQGIYFCEVKISVTQKLATVSSSAVARCQRHATGSPGLGT